MLDLAPKLVRGTTLYIAINITRKLERFKEKGRKRGKPQTPLSLSLFTPLHVPIPFPLEKLDNFVLRHGIYCAILASFLFYCGISSFLRQNDELGLSFYRARNIALPSKSEFTTEKRPSLVDPSDPNVVSALYLVNQSGYRMFFKHMIMSNGETSVFLNIPIMFNY